MHTVCSGVFIFLHLMPLTKGRTRQPSGPAPAISIYVLPKVASNPPVKSNMARKKIKLDWKENKQICEFSSLSTTINCFHGLLTLFLAGINHKHIPRMHPYAIPSNASSGPLAIVHAKSPVEKHNIYKDSHIIEYKSVYFWFWIESTNRQY